MKIGLVGTHSVGKTTLVDALKTESILSDYFFDVNVTRWIRSLGFPINQRTNDHSQEINMIKRVANLNSFDNYIGDRTVIDVLAYTLYSYDIDVNITKRSVDYQRKLFEHNIKKYDYIFLLKPIDDNIEDDGVRSIDTIFRNRIARKIDSIINEYQIKTITLSGSTRERLNLFMKTIGVVDDRRKINANKVGENTIHQGGNTSLSSSSNRIKFE